MQPNCAPSPRAPESDHIKTLCHGYVLTITDHNTVVLANAGTHSTLNTFDDLPMVPRRVPPWREDDVNTYR